MSQKSKSKSKSNIDCELKSELESVELDSNAEYGYIKDIHVDEKNYANKETQMNLRIELPSGVTKNINLSVPKVQNFEESKANAIIDYIESPMNENKIPIKTSDEFGIDWSRISYYEENQDEQNSYELTEGEYDMMSSIGMLITFVGSVVFTSILSSASSLIIPVILLIYSILYLCTILALSPKLPDS